VELRASNYLAVQPFELSCNWKSWLLARAEGGRRRVSLKWTQWGGEPVNWESLLGEVAEITSAFLVRASTLRAYYSTLQWRDNREDICGNSGYS